MLLSTNHLKHLTIGSIVFFGLILLCLRPAVSADSYGVQATVPRTTLDQAASFSSGLDGTVTSDAGFTVSGNCQMLSQASVVSIWRDSHSLGSVACNSSRFSLQVILNEGVNQLIARTSDASANYGPDSSPITVTLSLPVYNPPPESTVSGAAPASTVDQTAAVNAGAAVDLQLVPATPFSVLPSDSKSVSIQVTVGGGNSPYVIMLNWGDGTTDSHSVAQAGTYSFSHTYQKLGSYMVKGAVHDVLGAYTEFNYAVVSYTKTPVPAAVTAVVPNQSTFKQQFIKTTLISSSIVGFGLGVAYAGYHIGVHNAAQAAVKHAAKRVPRKKVRRGKNI